MLDDVLGNLALIDFNMHNESATHFGSELMSDKFAIIIWYSSKTNVSLAEALGYFYQSKKSYN